MTPIDSLRLELAALEHQRLKDNAYLLTQLNGARHLVRMLKQGHPEASYLASMSIRAWDKEAELTQPSHENTP